jgi:DNA-binding GntR family transcriptional regulator
MMESGQNLRNGETGALVYEQLRSAILSGELRAGDEIAQVDLAKRLGAGRTPLREALRILKEEGLVSSEPNRRVAIAEFSIEDLEELYVVRITLEATAVLDTVPTLSPEQIGRLEGLIATMTHFASQNDFERFQPPHREFHATLVSATGPRMTRLISQLSDHAERYRRAYMNWGSSRDVYDMASAEHRAILDAASQGQAELTVDRLIGHYMRTAQGVFAKLDPNYEPRRLLAHSGALISAKPS